MYDLRPFIVVLQDVYQKFNMTLQWPSRSSMSVQVSFLNSVGFLSLKLKKRTTTTELCELLEI